MQSTLAYAPRPEDLDEDFFDIPVLAMPRQDEDDEEPEQGEP